MVRNGRHVFRRKTMRASSPSSSTSSVYTSVDDARRCTGYERSQFLDSQDVGTTWLLGSHSSDDRSRQVLAKFKIDKSRFCAQHVIIIGAIVAALIIAVIISLSAYARSGTSDSRDGELLVPPDPESLQPPSWSKLRTFKRGAVCADGAPCAVIGKSILERNGSAVDAALAALICNGLVNMQSLGFGGGFMMTIYQRSTRRAFVLNARDRAPLAANSTMYDGKSANAAAFGALAVAVPGELAGYWEAHQQFGRLPWADLFKPSIELCEKGYVLTLVQYDGLAYNKKSIYNDPTLRKLFVDPATNEFRKPGSVIKPYALCETLRLIAERNATEFYNGTIGRLLVDDLQEQGGIITMKDLNEYRVSWDQPIQTNLSGGIKLLTTGLPGSGVVLSFILNVFEDYGFTPGSIADFNATILTYHRMIETFKYAFALRTNLGDGAIVDMSEIIRNLTSKSFARAIRQKIDDKKTWQDPQHYGSTYAGVEDHGTAHVSVLAQNGDAVSVTSTINYYFGSGVVSRRTGILLNNGMDDFGIPSRFNYFGMPPSPSNYIAPKKQPLSSMVPSILVDQHGDVKMIMGAAGGTRITTAVSQVTAKILWMGQTVKEAVDSARIHHQLFPPKVAYEYGIPKQVIDGLKGLGHATERYRDRGSVACVVLYENSTIFANADYRKGGDVYGIDSVVAGDHRKPAKTPGLTCARGARTRDRANRVGVYKPGSANAARPVSNRSSRSRRFSVAYTSLFTAQFCVRRGDSPFFIFTSVPENRNPVSYVRGARRRVRALQLRLRQAHLHRARRQAEEQTRGRRAHQSLRPERPFQKDSHQADEHRAQQTAGRQEQGVEIAHVPILAARRRQVGSHLAGLASHRKDRSR